jgi:hypothetical protein
MRPDRWCHEADRLYRRYQLEIVEACGLCPWAERARVEGRFRVEVLLQEDGVGSAGTAPTMEAIDQLVRDPEAEVAVFVFPRLHIGRLEFERFVGRLRAADAERHELGCIPYVVAAFHPEALPDASDPERMIPFLRRTPDPTIQLLRSDVLERVRSSTPQGTQFIDVRALESFETDLKGPLPSLRQRIARTNLATVERIGIAEMTRRMDAIVADRRATYRELETAAAGDEASRGFTV